MGNETEETDRKCGKKGTVGSSLSLISKQKIQESKKRSLEIVEKMLDEAVTEEWLITSCNYLSQADYMDAIEERSIIHLCGYPLCSKKIKDVKKKYHISVQNNKIYDITDRKCFCSNLCYKASNFLKVQLSDCPIWLKEKGVAVKLLSTMKNSGSPGNEVDIGHSRITKADIDNVPKNEPLNASSNIVPPYLCDSLENCAKEFENLTVSEKNIYIIDPDSLECTLLGSEEETYFSDDGGGKESNLTLSQSSHIETNKKVREGKASVKKGSLVHKKFVTSNDDDDDDDDGHKMFSLGHEAYEAVISDDKYMPVISRQTSRKSLLINPVGNGIEGRSISESLKANSDSLSIVENALAEWISEATFLLLLGEDKFESQWQEFIQQNDVAGPNIESKKPNEDKLNAMKEAYVKMCLKLEKEELEEVNYEKHVNDMSFEFKNFSETASQSSDEVLPEVKVAMFYRGQLDNPDDSTCKSKKIGKKTQKVTQKKKNTRIITPSLCPLKSVAPLEKVIDCNTERANKDSFLPVVDSLSQKTVRRQLVVDKLKIIYFNILPLIDLHYNDIRDDLRRLVSSFRLSPRNISFKPAEWKMLAVVLFRMLEKMIIIHCTWEKEKRWQLLQKTLLSFDISIPEIDTILDNVTDLMKLQKLWHAGSIKIC